MKNSFITIGNIVVHQSHHNYYRINDIQKAGNGSDFKEWFKNDYTKRLIKAIELKGGDLPPLYSITGRNGGTFVCKQLAYAYAHWISPEFYLLVIDTFDAVMNSSIAQEAINFQHRLDEFEASIEKREPRHQNTLAVLLGIATAKVKPYFDYLVEVGEVHRIWIPQPDKAEYHATTESQHVIGHKGKTVLFNETVKEIFPKQANWDEAL
jgi:hypothetical protein